MILCELEETYKCPKMLPRICVPDHDLLVTGAGHHELTWLVRVILNDESEYTS